ncbi:hypothetical protein [Dactylosporangium sp. NPDC000521]|uniref:hypothetical protein n=1 Tax=Dactylosporangium sp. NPDC000521 TaxID=3363975 RepID=UPI0036B906D9
MNVEGGRDLFDATVAHTLKLTFRDADYQRIPDAYFDEGEKEYLEADLVIDGVLVPSVGIGLKGNSTLGGLTRNGQTRPGGFRPGGGAQLPGPIPGGGPDPGGAQIPGPIPGGGQRGPAFGGGGPMGGRVTLKAEQPETLPG